ncbi:hypothetical protein GHK62_18480 [Sinorhizobium terangae]|uniref:Uncharacterized protein n=1 Tax=Sinorhizobium terangae TaxID=110322 RepID=A0A6N7LIV0_SINTE|nr:hypothetical protein [Sinorhizobium terangae]
MDRVVGSSMVDFCHERTSLFARESSWEVLLHDSLNRNRFKDKIMQQIKVLQRPLRVRFDARRCSVSARRADSATLQKFQHRWNRNMSMGGSDGRSNVQALVGQGRGLGCGLPAVTSGPARPGADGCR